MRAIPDTIWQVPAYLPYLQPPLTDEAVAAAEQEIGFALPTEFIDLLRRQNGGYIRFSLPQMVHDKIAGIGPHFPSLTEFDWDECQEYVSFPLRGLVPFDGDGHWHLCLDYRQNPDRPSVTYIDVECDRQSNVAVSFAGYLSLLRIDVGDAFVLESVPDIEKIKSQLSTALAVEFDPPDLWAHGYPTHCAALGTTADPEWLWISPNDVPRGFVRSDDPRFSALKDLLPGTAPQYPELPIDSFIFNVTSGVRTRLFDALIECRRAVRPLRDYIKGD